VTGCHAGAAQATSNRAASKRRIDAIGAGE